MSYDLPGCDCLLRDSKFVTAYSLMVIVRYGDRCG